MKRESLLLIALILFLPELGMAQALSLTVSRASPLPLEEAGKMMPDQIPMSRIALGKHNIPIAWLAGATDRYAHGILGDKLEAAKLMVQLSDGSTLEYELPESRVFEDLQPRLADLDADGREEIMVIETDVNLGASLSVYGVTGGELKQVASTPFIGLSNRWLNPLGVGDFDGDGKLDIAIIVTPHIGGILQLYHYKLPRLEKFSEQRGLSTHSIGSTELGLGVVVSGGSRDRLLLPDQSHRKLVLIEWTASGLRETASVELPARIVTSLRPSGNKTWVFGLLDGQTVEVSLK